MSKFWQTVRFGLLAAAVSAAWTPVAASAAKKKASAEPKEAVAEASAEAASREAQAAAAARIPWKTPAYTLVANGMDLRTALDTFAVAQGLSAVMSGGVAGSFSGSFQDVPPQEFLDRIATVHNLVWYYDGAALYFYAAGEIQTLLLDLQYMKAGEVRAMLAELGVEDVRFPLKTTSNDELVMVSGPPRYVVLIAELVAKADKLRELRTFNEVETQLFPLVHTWAEDVSFSAGSPESSGAIRGVASLLKEIMSAEGDARAHVRDPADGSAEALSPVEAAMLASFKPVIQAEPRLNAVIVRDVVSRMPMYERLIRQLDVPQRLVEIEVTVIELTKANALDWQLSLSGSREGNKMSGSVGQNPANLFSADDLAGKGLAGAVTYLGDKFAVNASLTALKSKNKARSISRTSLLTVNNLAAEMSDSQSYHARVIGTEVASLEEVSAGTTLQIKPRILPTGTSNVANQVWLSMRLDDGGFESITVDSMPMTRSSGLVTQTAVFEDESIMLAGYLRDIEETAGWGIPFLRDIPLIGWLFGGKSTKKETVQRMFIISPHIIDLDLEAVGRAQAARLRDLTVPEAMQDDADDDALERERRDLERKELRRIRTENAKDDLARRRAELEHQRELRDIERDNTADDLEADIREWRGEERELRREAKEGRKARKRRGTTRRARLLDSEELAAVRLLESAMENRDPQGVETAGLLAAKFPESAAVQLAAGGVWEDAGDMEAAMAAYGQAQQLEPENPEALWVLARAAGSAGEDDVKEDALLQLLKLEPDNADALWALAVMATGKEGTMYKAFEARYPDDPRAKEAAIRSMASDADDPAAEEPESPEPTEIPETPEPLESADSVDSVEPVAIPESFETFEIPEPPSETPEPPSP
jgi:type III secretion protein C